MKYVYLLFGIGFFFLQIYESRIVVMEMYISTILAAVCLLQFFMGLRGVRCDWFYRWFGKDMAFYIYIFHVAVGITLGRVVEFPNLYLKSTVILLVSMGIYEVCFLAGKAIEHLRKKERI